MRTKRWFSPLTVAKSVPFGEKSAGGGTEGRNQTAGRNVRWVTIRVVVRASGRVDHIDRNVVDGMDVK